MFTVFIITVFEVLLTFALLHTFAFCYSSTVAEDLGVVEEFKQTYIDRVKELTGATLRWGLLGGALIGAIKIWLM